jgi:hypothetical protein
MAAGSIVIDLLMRTGMFETDVARAEKALDKFQKRAAQMGAAVGAAAVAAGTALAVMVKQSINSMDDLTKLAQSVGTTTEELSALTYAADLSGVSQDNLGTALTRLTKNASDAAQGIGEAQKGFNALGISVKDAEGNLKSSDQLLQEVAGKFAQFEDGANKTALAVNLFGKSGADLIPLLNAGAEGIQDMKDEAEELGLTFDQDAGKAAEAFNDNLTRLIAVKDGLVNRIAQELLPSLVSLTDRFFESAKGGDRLDKIARSAATGVKLLGSVAAIVAGIFRTVGEALGGIAAAVVNLVTGNFAEAWEVTKAFSSDIVGNIKQTAADVSAIWDDAATRTAADAEENAAKLAAPILKAEEKARGAARRIADHAARVRQQVEEAIARIQRDIATFGMTPEEVELFDLRALGADADQLARAADALDTRRLQRSEREAYEERMELEAQMARRYRETLEAIDDQRQLVKLSADEQEIWNNLKWAGVDAESALGEAIVESTRKLQADREAIERQIEAMDSVRDAGRGLFNDLARGANPLQALEDALDRIHQRITDMISERLMDQLFGKQGDPGGGSAGGWLGSIFGAIFGGAKASGGDILPNRGYWVGEEGPEWFQPRTAGTILPAAATAALATGGGRGQTITQNFINPRMQDLATDSQKARRQARIASRESSRFA